MRAPLWLWKRLGRELAFFQMRFNSPICVFRVARWLTSGDSINGFTYRTPLHKFMLGILSQFAFIVAFVLIVHAARCPISS